MQIAPGRALIRTMSSLLGINLLVSGLSFFTTVSIAVVLGSSAFGILSYALALGGYMVTVAGYGSEQTLVRDLAQNPDRFDDYVSASMIVRATMMVLATFLLFAENALATGDGRLALAGLAVAFLEGIKALHVPQVFDVWNRMERHAVYFLIERSIYFTLIWTALMFFRQDFSMTVIAIAMAISTVAGFSMQYSWALPRISLRLSPGVWAIARSMWVGNFWIWMALLSTLSFGGLSKLVLQYVSGSSELGEYSVAWLVVTMGSLVTGQLGRIAYPHLARFVQSGVHNSRTRGFLAKYLALLVAAAAVIGLPAILFPSLLLQVLGPQYSAAAGPLRVLGVYVILLGVGQVGIQYLISSRRGNLYATITILTGVLSPLLYLVLVPRMEAVGAALAVVVAHGLAIAIYMAIMLWDLFGPGTSGSAGECSASTSR